MTLNRTGVLQFSGGGQHNTYLSVVEGSSSDVINPTVADVTSPSYGDCDDDVFSKSKSEEHTRPVNACTNNTYCASPAKAEQEHTAAACRHGIKEIGSYNNYLYPVHGAHCCQVAKKRPVIGTYLC